MFSLAGRFEVIVDKSVKPGPGAYYPEKVFVSILRLCNYFQAAGH